MPESSTPNSKQVDSLDSDKLDRVAKDQVRINDSLNHLAKVAEDLVETASTLVIAVKARPTKWTGVLFVAFVFAVQSLFLFGGYRILSDLDPSSQAYRERLEQRQSSDLLYTRISNCILEESIIEQLNENFEEASLQLSESCAFLKGAFPQEYSEALEARVRGGN